MQTEIQTFRTTANQKSSRKVARDYTANVMNHSFLSRRYLSYRSADFKNNYCKDINLIFSLLLFYCFLLYYFILLFGLKAEGWVIKSWALMKSHMYLDFYLQR